MDSPPSDGPAMQGYGRQPTMVGLRPLDIGGLIDAATKIYRTRWKTLIISVAIVTTPVLILTAFVQVSAGSPTSLVRTSGATGVPEFNGRHLGVLVAFTLVLLLLSTVAGALALAAAFRSVSGAYLGDDPDWRTSLQFARERVGSVLWVIFLTTLLSFLGVLACGIGFVYALGTLSVAVPVLLVENVRGSSAARAEVDATTVSTELAAYAVALVRRTRDLPSVAVGASPRAAVHLVAPAKASARMGGRAYVTPDDVVQVAMMVLRHRLVLRPKAELERFTPDAAIANAIAAVPVPR